MKDFELYIPENKIIAEHGYIKYDEIVKMLKKYKQNPDAIQFIADMME
jgi:hypothetical protein